MELISPVKARNLASTIKSHADVLVPKWHEVTEKAKAFIPALLDFAVAYKSVYDDVNAKWDKDAVKQLNKSIGLSDTAASRLRDIADARKQLSPHVALLPASMDAIHSVAVLATDEHKRFEKAIRDGRITPSLTVRDARDLQPQRRASPKVVSAPRWQAQVSFSGSRDEAAQSLATLLQSPAVKELRVPEAKLRDAIKGGIGKENWPKVQNRLVK